MRGIIEQLRLRSAERYDAMSNDVNAEQVCPQCGSAQAGKSALLLNGKMVDCPNEWHRTGQSPPASAGEAGRGSSPEELERGVHPQGPRAATDESRPETIAGEAQQKPEYYYEWSEDDVNKWTNGGKPNPKRIADRDIHDPEFDEPATTEPVVGEAAPELQANDPVIYSQDELRDCAKCLRAIIVVTHPNAKMCFLCSVQTSNLGNRPLARQLGIPESTIRSIRKRIKENPLAYAFDARGEGAPRLAALRTVNEEQSDGA